LEKLLEEVITAKSKTKKNGKIEKADILEIAVNRMKEMKFVPRGQFHFIHSNLFVQQVLLLLSTTENSTAFKQGYDSCLTEVKMFLENNDFEFSQEIVNQLEHRKKQQLSSLGFCSVIRHTNQVSSEMEVTSTSTIVTVECDSSMWRPW
jgi:hypothetical protein